MQVLLDSTGHIIEWVLSTEHGKMSHKDAIEINLPENFDKSDFINNYRLYCLQDQQLIKDTGYQLTTQNFNKKLTKEQKLELFLNVFDEDEQPDPIDGFEFIPYFDRKNMKFSWKAQYRA